MFRVDAGSGVPIYRQLVEQVRREVMLGRLQPGAQLPTLREVVDALAVNPNTVAKAYAEMEHEGLVVRRQGMGTFITAAPPTVALVAPPALRNSLVRWLHRAREAGLSSEQIQLLVSTALDDAAADSAREGGVA
jgi:DNA-binding transcriptional regulator YhcF (GntR family)